MLHLIWFHVIHIKHVKRKPTQTIIRKNELKRESSIQFVTDRVHILKKKLESKKQRKKSIWIKPWLNNCMYTSAFNNAFAELMVNDKDECRWYFHLQFWIADLSFQFCKYNMKKYFIFAIWSCLNYIFILSFFNRKVFHKQENSENRSPEFSCFMKGCKKYIKHFLVVYTMELLWNMYSCL